MNTNTAGSVTGVDLAAMTERPILFSGAMVRALLEGTKTQTRRAINPQPIRVEDSTILAWRGGLFQPERVINSGMLDHCRYGQPGDRLWVRETFMDLQGTGIEHRDSAGQRQRYAFAADCPPGSYGDEARKDYGLKWKPSIHMPRAASRILLEVTGVRVERLQDISENDCWAEGIDAVDGALDDIAILELAKRMNRSCHDAAPTYAALWESINSAGSWDANPWVWVVEFKRVTP